MSVYFIWKIYLHFTIGMALASPGKQHCAKCIGTLSLPIIVRTFLTEVASYFVWRRTRNLSRPISCSSTKSQPSRPFIFPDCCLFMRVLVFSWRCHMSDCWILSSIKSINWLTDMRVSADLLTQLTARKCVWFAWKKIPLYFRHVTEVSRAEWKI